MDKMTLALAAIVVLGGCGKRDAGNGKGPFDLVLRNGWIVDGSGNPRYRGDVAIRGDRIAAVGFLNGAAARETLDVRGLVVAPGFIDMMGQSEIYALIDSRLFSKITQGVTTEVTGEGGSVAPLTDRLVVDDSDAMKKWHYREDWRDLDGYFAQLGKQGSALNIATFVGATQVRLAVVGKENRQPTALELAHMSAIVDTLMEQGALGVWTALEYAPASYSRTEEIITLAKAARRHGGIYASHMRNEGIRIDDALDEVFRIAREADIPAEISHLKLAGRASWGRMPRVLARIDSARAAGLDITAGLVFRELVTRLAGEGKIILCSSHELSLVENVCSEVVILHRGRVVARGSIEELRHLRNQSSLEAVFSDLVASDNIENVAREMLELVMDA